VFPAPRTMTERAEGGGYPYFKGAAPFSTSDYGGGVPPGITTILTILSSSSVKRSAKSRS
jgi:hypothetical protein